MGSMLQLGDHKNIVKLHEVLELVQDSKTTLFLVMDLVTGGELFERMKNGQGMSENYSKRYDYDIFFVIYTQKKRRRTWNHRRIHFLKLKPIRFNN
jgi:serine/threonine protein kinase